MSYEYLYNIYGLCDGIISEDEDYNKIIISIDNESTIVTTYIDNLKKINVYYLNGTQEEYYRV